jgi:hypothetical protein
MVALTKTAEVRRILERYLVEVVERYELCPWARGARERREIAVGVLWGTPSLDAWLAEAQRLLEVPVTRVAMVIAPELETTREAFAALRDRVAQRLPAAGVAEFFPAAALDLSTPARLVPFLRSAPDPLLQLVPLALIDAMRAAPPSAGLAQQASMLGGHAAPPPRPPADRIAAANHAAASQAHPAIAAVLADIAADRRAAYARVGITASP